MLIYSLFFYVFAALLVVSSFVVILVKNPVHSILWLIFAFFNAAGLFVLLGAEFLAAVLVIVYVGAVAVLFLFVVMMLNVNFTKLKEGFHKYVPICSLIALVLFVDLFLVVTNSTDAAHNTALSLPFVYFSGLTNTHAIGSVLYTRFMPVFLIAGLILLVAMISAIVLAYRRRENVKSQDAKEQVYRSVKDSIEVVKVEIRRGVR
ncbi:MAG: NADH-quinone oxidoreductase subunit J [Rickettsiales bacterium]|jgi:NADH-quinone oxidoreductase subunit J|nr:NADH-quinone oxidoreductase subunit J [Rickettsiales bacterium]